MVERSRLTPCKTAQRQSFCGEAPTSNLTSVTTVDLIFSPFILHLVFNQYSALVIATDITQHALIKQPDSRAGVLRRAAVARDAGPERRGGSRHRRTTLPANIHQKILICYSPPSMEDWFFLFLIAACETIVWSGRYAPLRSLP